MLDPRQEQKFRDTNPADFTGDNPRTGRTEIVHVKSIDEAARLLREKGENAKLLAGGLDVMGLMKSRIARPEVLVDLKPVERLRFMVGAHRGVSLGALTRIRDIERSDLIRSNLPMLARAARLIGSPHVRNMASLAGNLCQQTRCWYFRRGPETGLTFHCHRKGNMGVCYARDGQNPYHALIGHETCASAFPSDLGIVLSAMGAKIKTIGPDGGRTLPVEELYSPAGLNLQPGEIIVSAFVPAPQAETRQNFVKFRVRRSIDFALVSVATSFRLQDGVVETARIFLGGVSPTPYRAVRAELVLEGKELSPSLLQDLAEAATVDARPMSRNAYKIQLIKALVKRAVLESCGRESAGTAPS